MLDDQQIRASKSSYYQCIFYYKNALTPQPGQHFMRNSVVNNFVCMRDRAGNEAAGCVRECENNLKLLTFSHGCDKN